jgi:hypothetical protein
LPLPVLLQPTTTIVISTAALDSITVQRAVERPPYFVFALAVAPALLNPLQPHGGTLSPRPPALTFAVVFAVAVVFALAVVFAFAVVLLSSRRDLLLSLSLPVLPQTRHAFKDEEGKDTRSEGDAKSCVLLKGGFSSAVSKPPRSGLHSAEDGVPNERFFARWGVTPECNPKGATTHLLPLSLLSPLLVLTNRQNTAKPRVKPQNLRMSFTQSATIELDQRKPRSNRGFSH